MFSLLDEPIPLELQEERTARAQREKIEINDPNLGPSNRQNFDIEQLFENEKNDVINSNYKEIPQVEMS
jgi:hypothetical protein